jgi:hypothetical protein
MAIRTQIRVGQNVRRDDGITGYVDTNPEGITLYGPWHHFRIVWDDGSDEVRRVSDLAHEGITLTPGRRRLGC